MRQERDAATTADTVVALSIEAGPAPEPEHILFRWPGRYNLTLGRSGEAWFMASSLDGVFLIDTERRTIRCFDTRPDGAWQDILSRRVLPRVAMLFGATTVHGAAVAKDGGGLVLLGQSGAGKSTLSAALGNSGWDVLSDDIAILWGSPAPAVAPSTTGVCVWRDSRTALNLPDTDCQAMPGYDEKIRFVSGNDEATAGVPLKAIIFLDRSPDQTGTTLYPISGGEALVRASHHRIRFNPADRQGGETIRTFEGLSRIVRSTPCFRLSYPQKYEALPHVADTLKELLQA